MQNKQNDKRFSNREVYNVEMKERFLKQYDQTTAERYKYTFLNSAPFEKTLNKDVFQITNTEDALNLLASFNSTSYQSIASNVSTLKMYVDFYIHENYEQGSNIPINIWDTINDNNLFKVISKLGREEKYIHKREEYKNFLRLCINAQDAICFILAFHNISATDMPKIETKDFNFVEGTLNFQDHIYKFEEEEMNYIKKAMNETFYHSLRYYSKDWEKENEKYKRENNGKEKRKTNESMYLKKSKYLLRGAYVSILKQESPIDNPVKNQVPILRIKKTSTYILDKPLLNPKNISKSGMYLMLYEREKGKGNLNREDFLAIQRIYNITSTGWKTTENNYKLWKSNVE